MTRLVSWAMAIMEFEGYHKGSRSYKNNNPGNLKWFATPHDDSGHSIFPTFQDGWDTLIHQLELAVNGESKVYNPEMTLREFHQHYSEANQTAYAEFVAARLGITSGTKIKELK